METHRKKSYHGNRTATSSTLRTEVNVTVVPELTSPPPAQPPGTDQQAVGDPPDPLEIDDELPAGDNFALLDAAARTITHLTSWHLEPQSATAMKDAIQACPMASVPGPRGPPCHDLDRLQRLR